MWVSWSHSFRVSVTRELLEALLSHTILLRIVEGREKVGSRARNDRPKAFRPLLARSEDVADGCGELCARGAAHIHLSLCRGWGLGFTGTVHIDAHKFTAGRPARLQLLSLGR